MSERPTAPPTKAGTRATQQIAHACDKWGDTNIPRLIREVEEDAFREGAADERERLAGAVRALVWIRASNGKVAIDAGDVYAIFGLDDLQPDTASAERGE